MRILLADNETNVRYGLRTFLEERPGLEVVGEAADAGELLAQLQAACPDLVLLSWDLHPQRGALVEGDVLLTVGDATLEDRSAISGRLRLSPEPGQGYVHREPDARVNGGVSYPDSINLISGLRVAAFFLRQLLKRILPLVAVILVLVLLVWLGQRRRAQLLADSSAPDRG